MDVGKAIDNSNPLIKDDGEIEEFFDILLIKLLASNQEGLFLVQRQRADMVSKAVATGNLGNGRMFLWITEIFANQIKIHQRTIRDLINEVYRGFSFDLDNQIKDSVLSFSLRQFDFQKNTLVNEMLSGVPFTQGSSTPDAHRKKIIDTQTTNLENISTQEKEQLAANVKLLLRTLQKEKDDMKSGHTINVTGNISNLQVGDGNTIINETSKTTIINSFKEIRDALQTSAFMNEEKHQEISSLMNECEIELNEATPNKTKIGAYLGAVGSAIKGIATLGNAYSTIRMFSQAFGGPILP